ncbi:MAG: Undecaprenyl diphosphate synthase, partial [uncultured Gemmatimonadetes bacterium]
VLRAAPPGNPAERNGAPPRGRHHGRQRALGAGTRAAARVRAPRRHAGRSPGRGGRGRRRGRGADALRLFAGELGAPRHRDL